MGKWWNLIKGIIRAWLGFEDAKKAEQAQAMERAQVELQDWGEGIIREVKTNEEKAHQEIVDTQPVDGGRRAALERLDRLRGGGSGGSGGDWD